MMLDKWQKEIKAFNGNILLAKGRRIGATYVMAEKAVDWLVTHENKHPSSQIVCVSITDDQAQLIIAFATNYAKQKYPKLVGKGKNKPTMKSLSIVINKNRRILLARPVGATGDSVRGFEGQILMVDEGAKMPKLFWAAAKPILATTGGHIWMWGTFFGKENYFYRQYIKCLEKKGRYKVWMKTTEEVFKNREISEDWTEKQKKEALKFLEDEKKDMSRLVYAQEYLAIASEDLRQFFPDELIAKSCVLEKEKTKGKGRYYLGCDVARMDRDEFSYEIIRKDGEKLFHVESIVTLNIPLTRSARTIISLNAHYDFRKEYIDSGGMGIAVCDILREDEANKRKVVEINNASRIYDVDRSGKENRDKKKKLIKEELYNNLKSLMETGKIKLLNEDEVKISLKSIQAENREGRLFIWGSYSHIAEGLIRAAWCVKDKSLNIYVL